MMLFVLNVALFCSLWSSIFARPFLATAPLSRRGYSLSSDDPRLPAAVQSICPGGLNATTVSSSIPFGTGGASLTTGSCKPQAPAPASNNTVNRATCQTAPNDCSSRFSSEWGQYSGQGFVAKCGDPCSSTCYPGGDGPDPNDCQIMINTLYAQSQQLFTLGPNAFYLFSDQTCGIGIQNQIASSPIGCSQTMVYDYSDVASIAQYLAWNCQAAQGAQGGRCLGNTGLYQLSIPDFYVQVYRNN